MLVHYVLGGCVPSEHPSHTLLACLHSLYLYILRNVHQKVSVQRIYLGVCSRLQHDAC